MSHIHDASFSSSQLLLASTPLFVLVTTLLAMAIGLGSLLPNHSPDNKKRLESIEDPREPFTTAHKLRKAVNFGEICSTFGYGYEEHVVTTSDGYLLALHRILPGDFDKNKASNSALKSKRVVFFQHGLLTNSEFFIALSDVHCCLPFVLVDNGYDVWLGNNRGNKYSHKHTTLSTSSHAFWDFSLDELAKYDVPSFIAYILSHTNQPNLSYIGFSQGSAQAFAALSSNKELNSKLNVFIALAPIMRPRGYASTILDQVVKKSPSIIHTLFGLQGLFPVVTRLQRILPTFILNFAVDTAVLHLLAFKNNNITSTQKLAGYPHLYCTSSVKSVVHWTQIMKHGEFTPFRNNCNTEIARYSTESITTPIVLIHGDSDSLFAPESVLEQLPSLTRFELKDYEHIDVIWGKNVHIDVVPKVLAILRDKVTLP